MANELTVTGSLSFTKTGVTTSAVGRSRTADTFTVSGSAYVQDVLSVATSATAIPLGGVTSPHWAFFYNLDSTNFLRIHNGSGGAKVIKLKAGEWAIVPLDDTSTPYATADTAACLLEYLIVQL